MATTSLLCAVVACVANSRMGAQPASGASNYSITGTVVSSSSGNPVPRCHVAAMQVDRGSSSNRRPGPRPQQDGVDCDERGHFSLSVAGAGSWSVRASAKGFRQQFYEEHENYSSSIVLTERTPTMEVLFKIAPNATIRGTVLDLSLIHI